MKDKDRIQMYEFGARQFSKPLWDRATVWPNIDGMCEAVSKKSKNKFNALRLPPELELFRPRPDTSAAEYWLPVDEKEFDSIRVLILLFCAEMVRRKNSRIPSRT